MSSTAVATTKEKPLGFMEQVGEHIFLYRPPSTTSSSGGAGLDPTSPKLILMGGWMAARDLHLAKYVARYQAIYPASAILLIRSTTKQMMVAGTFARDIKPAVPLILSILSEGGDVAATGAAGKTAPRILLHIFSNGGSIMLSNLYEQFRLASVAQTAAGVSDPGPTTLPPHVTLYDSCPGYYSYGRGVYALTASIPSNMRMFAVPVIHLFMSWYHVTYVLFLAWFGVRDPLSKVGDIHNDPKINRESARAYMYSKEDKTVGYRHVEQHAAQAVQNGFDQPRLELFEGSQHVTHARRDEGRYWSIVTETWEAGRVKEV